MITENDTDSTQQRIVWLKQNPWYCIKPFNTVLIKRNRQNQIITTPCCHWDDLTHNEFGVDLDHLFSDVKNDIRNQVTNSNCSRCQKQELTYENSERIRDSLGNLQGFDQQDKFYININFSNFCNLACRSCDSAASSTFAKLMNIKAYDELTQDISENSAWWDQTKNYIQQALDRYRWVDITVTGGEAMIQPGFDKLLDYLNTLKQHNRITLSFNTNLTTGNARLLEHCSRFRSIRLGASIDSVDENFHYVRWPAKFDKILTNLDKILEIPNLDLEINLVPSLNNIFYIDDIVEFWQQWTAKNNCPDLKFTIVYLSQPESLKVETIPVQYRQALLARCKSALNNSFLNNPVRSVTRKFFNDLCRYLESDQIMQGPTHWHKFLWNTASYDNRSNCFMKEYNSRLWEILDSDHRSIYTTALKIVQNTS